MIWLLWVLHVSGTTQYLSICDWLISLSMMSLRFIHVVVYWRISFLFKAEKYSIIRVLHFAYSQIGRWTPDLFPCLIIANNTAMNLGIQLSLWDPAFNSIVYILRSGIAGFCVNSIFNFVRNFYTVPPLIFYICLMVVADTWMLSNDNMS